MRCMHYGTLWLAAILAVSIIYGVQSSTAEARDKLRVIVPLGAGGALDRFARTAERFLPEIIKADVEIENFAAKKGEDGYRTFLNHSADGNTVLAWFEPAAAAYGPGMSFDDLAVINVQEIEAPILAVQSNLGWKNLGDMIEAIRQRPEAYRLAIGSRTGGGPLLASALLSNLGLKVRRANFASGGKARKAVMRGDAEITAGSLNALRKLGDKVTPIAAFAPRRLRAWPEVPTIREALGPNKDSAVHGAVYRFFAVHKTFAESNPKAFSELVEAFRRMTQDSADFRADSEKRGVGARWFGPKESTSLIRRSHQQYRDLINQQQ